MNLSLDRFVTLEQRIEIGNTVRPEKSIWILDPVPHFVENHLKVLFLLLDAGEELVFARLPKRVIDVDDDLVQNFGQATHLHETGRGVSLRGRVMRALREDHAVGNPGLNLGRVVHCVCESVASMTRRKDQTYRSSEED